MATMKMDQLNNPIEVVVDKRNVTPIAEYFQEMYLSDSEIEEREELANKILIIVSAILTIIKANEVLKKEHDIESYKDYISNKLQTLFDSVFGDGSYQDIIFKFSNEFVDNTMKHLNDPYFTSEERAIVNAEQQSNAVYNRKQFEDAKKDGKTKKKWVTMHDKRVRKAHDEADGQEVDIDKPFEVGGEELDFPCDPFATAKNVVNCRCVCLYR